MGLEQSDLDRLEGRLKAIESKVFKPPVRRYHKGKAVSFNLPPDRHSVLIDLLETGNYKNLSELMRIAVEIFIFTKSQGGHHLDKYHGDDDMEF
jgi:ASC-1-like (ASCH) protein